MTTTQQRIDEIAAHNFRVRGLSVGAWVLTIGVALAAATSSSTLDAVGWYAALFAASVNVGSFFAYLVRMGPAARVHNAPNGENL